MKGIEEFATPGQQSTESVLLNTVQSKEVIKYLDKVSDLRSYFKKETLPAGYNSMEISIEKEEGVAVRLVGNAEIPRAENVFREVSVRTHMNATGWDISYLEALKNKGNSKYAADKQSNALRRLKLREDLDILQVFIASAYGSLAMTKDTDFDISKIRQAHGLFDENDYNLENGIKADTIFMSLKMYNILRLDPEYKIAVNEYGQVLRTGDIGTQVDGLNIIIINELGTTVILLDSTKKDALRIVENGFSLITKYSDGQHMTESTDIRHAEAPVCVERQVLFKMEVN